MEEARRREEAKMFSPHTSNRGKHFIRESVEERSQRLSKHDAERISSTRAETREAYYASFDFTPRINPKSEELAPVGSGGLDALHANPVGNMRRNRTVEHLQAELDRECTFKPSISEFPVSESAIPQFRDRAGDRARRDKWKRELEEAVECTFQPAVSGPPPPPPKVPIQKAVPGLDSFLSMRRLARELKQEQEAREDRIFLRDKLDLPLQRRFTVPTPFKFSQR